MCRVVRMIHNKMSLILGVSFSCWSLSVVNKRLGVLVIKLDLLCKLAESHRETCRCLKNILRFRVIKLGCIGCLEVHIHRQQKKAFAFKLRTKAVSDHCLVLELSKRGLLRKRLVWLNRNLWQRYKFVQICNELITIFKQALVNAA